MDFKIAAANQAYTQALKGAVPGGNGVNTVGEGGNSISGFANLVEKSLLDAVKSSQASEQASLKAVQGKADVTDVVQAVTNAEMALDTVIAVRDKVINAYQEILRMPV